MEGGNCLWVLPAPRGQGVSPGTLRRRVLTALGIPEPCLMLGVDGSLLAGCVFPVACLPCSHRVLAAVAIVLCCVFMWPNLCASSSASTMQSASGN